MFSPRTLVGVLAVVLIAGSGLLGQDKKDAEPPAKLKGYLPANYGKLGLSEEQKQKIYGAQARYKAKLEDLEKQIRDLKAQEKTELEGILTDAQRGRLREILTGKAPS